MERMERQPPSHVLASSRSQEQLVLPCFFSSLPRSEEEGCVGGKSVSVLCAIASLPIQQSEQLLLRLTKTHHDSLPPPCLPIFQRIDYVRRIHTYMGRVTKPVRNRISVYISVKSLWNQFQATSRCGLETALKSVLESVLTRLHTGQSKQV